MSERMKTFLHSNLWQYRMLRTILQGVIGVLIANVDVIVGMFIIDPTIKPMIVATVMAILSPVMSKLGEINAESDAEVTG